MAEPEAQKQPEGQMRPEARTCLPFSADFARELERLFVWRRDVRAFRREGVADEVIAALIAQAELSPSVGNSQPWRWVLVESGPAREAVRASFQSCNAAALQGFSGARAQLYAGLKLSGLNEAPVQLAVFCDHATDQGHGLGRLTMPRTLEYSVVSAIATFWLAARAQGIGVGWVSILDPGAVQAALDVPASYRLVAYLCVGLPEAEHAEPELERRGWQESTASGSRLLRR